MLKKWCVERGSVRVSKRKKVRVFEKDSVCVCVSVCARVMVWVNFNKE